MVTVPASPPKSISRKFVFSLTTARADIAGGLVSATVAIPLAMAFGMFAFVSLGDAYFAYGALAGLGSAATVGIACVLLGDATTLIYAPRITSTFFLGQLLLSLLHSGAPGAPPDVAATLLTFFTTILLGGLLQALFGAMRLGTLIKFTPHPVMAGFQNMAAVLLFLVQFCNVLGFPHSMPFTRVFGALDQARPLSLAVAAVAFLATWNGRRLSTRVPPVLAGLGAGCVAYYALALMGFGDALGPVIGPRTASAAMRTVLVDFSGLAMITPLAQSAPTILSGALALAIIASIDALLCAKLASPPGTLRAGDEHLLVRLGLANAAAACFSGITSGINIGPTILNRAFGGRSRLSVAVNAAAVLAAATLLFPLLAYLPRAVLSAVIMVIAIQHIDPWTRQSLARLVARGTPLRGTLALDLAVAMSVSLLSITINIVLAVFIGIALAVLLFVVRMSRSNVRRLYRCDVVRSRRSRQPAELEVLQARGSAIVVLELQGALFFGSAERLAQIVDGAATAGTSAVLLDLRRVTEIDTTGTRILADIDAALAARGATLALVLPGGSEDTRHLAATLPAEGRIFPDIDRAIEWAEDALLRGTCGTAATELSLGDIALLRDFSPAQIERLRPSLQDVAWPSGHTIFRAGDPGSTLYLVTRGRASVRLDKERSDIRLVTFAPGAVFGELAILDRGPRSATVTVDEDLAGFALTDAAFAVLRRDQPDIAIMLLAALGRELSVRLRYANMTVQQLEA